MQKFHSLKISNIKAETTKAVSISFKIPINLKSDFSFKSGQYVTLRSKINGELRQNSSTSNMFIKIPEIISKISTVMTLEKGDIISTGTPAGVMLNKPNAVFLKDGDKVEMEIEGLGRLNNTIKVVKSN